MGEYLRKTGGEVGVTTGRLRRCGWFDAVIARYASRVNGITDYFLTKLDVLSQLEQVPICVAYDVDGERYDEMPMTQSDLHHAKPIYEYLPGWFEDISHCRTFDELPANAQAYVRRLEEISGARISSIGVGPGRDQTIVLHDVLAAGPQPSQADDPLHRTGDAGADRCTRARTPGAARQVGSRCPGRAELVFINITAHGRVSGPASRRA